MIPAEVPQGFFYSAEVLSIASMNFTTTKSLHTQRRCDKKQPEHQEAGCTCRYNYHEQQYHKLFSA